MSFKVEKVSGEPIIVAIMYEDYDLAQELHPSNAAAAKILEEHNESMTLIVDLRCNLNLEEMMIGAAGTSRGEASLYHDPRLRGVVYVTTNPAIQLGLKGLNSEAYNYLKIPSFETLGDALDYVRGRTG